jgi:hypothetical protein
MHHGNDGHHHRYDDWYDRYTGTNTTGTADISGTTTTGDTTTGDTTFARDLKNGFGEVPISTGPPLRTRCAALPTLTSCRADVVRTE